MRRERRDQSINGVHISPDVYEALLHELPVTLRPPVFRSGLWAPCRLWLVVEDVPGHHLPGPVLSMGRGCRSRPDYDACLVYLGVGTRNMIGYGECRLPDGTTRFDHMRMDGVRS